MKHEYAEGDVFAMSGGTLEHSLVAANFVRELGNGLAGRDCRVLTSDMRVGIEAGRRYVYPDASVVCGPPVFEDDQRDTLVNPTIVVEVLSDSTEAYDRGDKFAQYRRVAALREYVLASQKGGQGQTATLQSISCTLVVERLYAGVSFPA